MADDEIPDEFTDTVFSEAFPAEDFRDWLERDADEDIRDDIDELLDTGFSLEWAVALTAEDISPDEIESVTFHRDDEGWSVFINDTEFTFDDPDLATDYIWADLYFHLQYMGLDIDREIDTPGVTG